MAAVTVLGTPDDDDGFFQPITTWQGLHAFVSRPRPEAPPADDLCWSLPALQDYHSRFVVVTTPAMREVSLQLRRLTLLNKQQQGTARRGLIVSGPPGAGKSTILMELARVAHLADQRRHPGQSDRLPVAYVMVPPSYTPKNLVCEFARFLGIPLHKRMNQAQITDAVCHVLCQRRTQLVFVDDVHLLNTRFRTGAETSDQIKHLAERIPSTFVLAGVDVETSPLLAGVRGEQLAARFKLVRATPLPYGTAAEQEAWRQLVRDLETALRLRAHRPGTLVGLAGYLQRRTGGVMASLSQLVREAALACLEDGSHAITKKHLAEVRLDVRATRAMRPTRKPDVR
ncbi:ATP-binding protein [Streptomyces sp. NPDC052012]|uniref:ATP-binding protein n=1 Tax=Streptomyces sp. NPDC052012 TaxID=3155051 RepID=UPI00344CF39C